MAVPAQRFDLTDYGAAVRALKRRGTRILLLIGVGFSLGGVATLGYLWYESGYPGLGLSATILAIFIGAGCLFFWLPIARNRPWNLPKTLEVDETGLGIVYGNGRATRHGWADLGLAVTLRSSALESGDAGRPSPVLLDVTPGSDVALVPSQAADYVAGAARLHNLSAVEEGYQGVLPWISPAPRAILNRVFARLPFGQATPIEAWPFPEMPLSAEAGRSQSFDLVAGRLRSDALGIERPAKVGTLIVLPTGLRIDRANRPPKMYEFRDRRIQIHLFRRLESAVTPLDAPRSAWRISLSGIRSEYYVSGVARAAIIGAAQAASLDVRSSRYSFPSQPYWHWLANTTIRSAGRSRS